MPAHKTRPDVISLFSGVGGFDLGLERAGFRVVAQCEKDEWRRGILEHHWPGVPLFEDVATFPRSDIMPSPDLICGGFPCQDVFAT